MDLQPSPQMNFSTKTLEAGTTTSSATTTTTNNNDNAIKFIINTNSNNDTNDNTKHNNKRDRGEMQVLALMPRAQTSVDTIADTMYTYNRSTTQTSTVPQHNNNHMDMDTIADTPSPPINFGGGTIIY